MPYSAELPPPGFRGFPMIETWRLGQTGRTCLRFRRRRPADELVARTSLVVPFDPDFECWTVAAFECFKALSVADSEPTVWD